MNVRVSRSGAALLLAALVVLPASTRGQPEPATAVIVNDLDRDVLIWIEGEPRMWATAFDRVVIDSVPPGSITLLASGQGLEGVVASEQRVVAPGERFRWALHPVAAFDESRGTSLLVIRNGLDETVDVILEGKVFGRLAPGSSRTIRRVGSGEATLAARDIEGHRVYEREIVLVPDEITRWTIGPPD